MSMISWINTRRRNVIDFGRYKKRGLTIPQLLFTDPDYMFWAIEDQVFPWPARAEANDLYRRATAIRIPAGYGDNVAVEYAIDRHTGRFEGMSLVPTCVVRDGGSSHSLIRGVIDMSIPHQQCPRDKGGNKIMIRDIKEIVFGSPKYRLTKKFLEAFFNNDDNFALDGIGRVT